MKFGFRLGDLLSKESADKLAMFTPKDKKIGDDNIKPTEKQKAGITKFGMCLQHKKYYSKETGCPECDKK